VSETSNQTAAPPRDDAPATGFYQLAEARPNRPAIIDPDASVLTFGQLGRQVNRLSHALRSHGLAGGDVVAAVVHNGHEYLELLLAAGQVGVVLVPVNWRLAVSEIVYIVRDSEAKLVVAAAEQARELPVGDLPGHRYVIGGAVDGWLPYSRLGEHEPASAPKDRRAGGMMPYTSGTTGHPKGVHNTLPAVDPETIASLFTGIPGGYGIAASEGVHLVCSPLYHAAPGGHALGFLHSGHTIVIQAKFNAEDVLRAIERYRVTTVHMVPTHFHRLLQLPEGTRTRYDLSSLQAVIHAGAPCPVPIKKEMLDWLGPIVWEYLGSTEGTVSRVSPQEWLTRPGTVGRPLPGLTVKILGADGEEARTGEPGTIYFGYQGRPPSFEYHHDPEKTASGRRGNLITAGDYGRLDGDGYLYLLDRRTDLIISGGVNIYPAEIEQALITHPAVNDVAVIGVPDPEWGHQVFAVIQPAAGVIADASLAAELLEYCGRQLASFKRPRRFEFVSDFPRTETGKVQRRVLRDAYAARSPGELDLTRPAEAVPQQPLRGEILVHFYRIVLTLARSVIGPQYFQPHALSARDR
jgi:long-chain acyl-CoA synthetase